MGLIVLTSIDPLKKPVNDWPHQNSWLMLQTYYADLVALNNAVSAGGGLINGGGTVNYIPLFTPNGQTLGNSVLSQSGGKVKYVDGNQALGTTLVDDGSGTGLMVWGLPAYTPQGTTTATAGGLISGTNLGTTPVTIKSILDLILYPYVSPTFSAFAISGQTQSLEVGASVSGAKTLTWTTTTPANVAVNSIVIRDVTGAANLATGLADDGSEAGIAVGTITLSAPGAYSWRGQGTNTNAIGFNSANFTVNWYFRMFYGTSANTTLTENQIEALINNPLASTFAGTFALAAGDYKYFAWPDSFGSPTASIGFKDANTNLPIAMVTTADDATYNLTANGWSYKLVSVTNGTGSPVTTNYRLYRTLNSLGGALTVTIS